MELTPMSKALSAVFLRAIAAAAIVVGASIGSPWADYAAAAAPHGMAVTTPQVSVPGEVQTAGGTRHGRPDARAVSGTPTGIAELDLVSPGRGGAKTDIALSLGTNRLIGGPGPTLSSATSMTKTLDADATGGPVLATPFPPGLALFGIGLALLGVLGRRRKRRVLPDRQDYDLTRPSAPATSG